MIYAIVVIYNVACHESDTCQSLLKQTSDGFEVLVYDNSDKDYNNQFFCQEQGWLYLGGSGNKGLSKAYNHSIDVLFRQKKNGYICFLDDDTLLPANHFEKLQAYISCNFDADILLPILIQKGKIISPCRNKKFNRYFSTVRECMNEAVMNIQAFNACMTVNSRIYTNYQYDERIFLDGVDHAFLRDMKQCNKKITVIPLRCEHGFSGGQKGSLKGAVSRFKIYASDSRILYEKNQKKFWYIVGKRALHLSLMYKNIIFIKALLLSSRSEY